MNIQEGKYYIARNGELVGPMMEYAEGGFMYADGWKVVWSENGKSNCPYSPDLVDTVDNAARKHVEGV